MPLIDDMRTYGLNWLGGVCDDEPLERETVERESLIAIEPVGAPA